MSLDWVKQRVADGAAQDARLLYALRKGYFRPQERALHDHLAMSARLAREIRLRARSGDRVQNWAPLFDHEPAIAMSEILSTQLAESRLEFEEALDRDPETAARLLRRRAANLVGIRRVLLTGGYTVLAEQIDGLGDDMPTPALLAILDGPRAPTASELAGALAQLANHELGTGAIGRAHAARRSLVHAHEHLLAVYDALRPRVARAFEARITSGDIDPALGLLISQFHLLGDVQDRMNGFVDAHTQFYYRRLLGQAPRPASPETVLLRFLPAGPPTPIDKGARALGRVSGTPEPVVFELLDSVRVVSTRVSQSRNLIFDRDPLISSQSTLGFVTGVRSSARPIDGSEDSERIFVPSALSDVDMGIDLRSDILRLAEGRRTIVVRIKMQQRQEIALPAIMPRGRRDEAAVLLPADTRLSEMVRGFLQSDPHMATAFATARPRGAAQRVADRLTAQPPKMEDLPIRDRFFAAALDAADTPDKVRAVLGRLVTETLVEGLDWPSGDMRAALLEKLAKYPPEAISDPTDAPYRMDKAGQDNDPKKTAVEELTEWFDLKPADVYQRFLAGGFRVSLSTEAGEYHSATARAVPNAPGDGPGLTLRLILDEAVPPIVPEPGDDAPVMRIRMDNQCFFSPYSLFEPYAIDQITTEVKVEGLKSLTGFSDDGPLDLSQPFAPFGSIPQDRAEFLVGAREMALKQVSRVAVDITWAGLPRQPGGFYDYYEGYGPDFEVPQPKVSSRYLTAEGWKELEPKPVPMTAPQVGQVGLVPERRLERIVPGRPIAARSGTSETDFLQRQRIRAGMLKLTLHAPGEAFGHSAYSAALSRSMRGGLLPFRRRVIPRQPFTPEIGAISLDYVARDTIDVDSAEAARRDQKVIQVTPFGSNEIYPGRAAPGAGIFMRRMANGCLYLRLDGPGTEDTVSLLFEMEHGSHKRIAFQPPEISWKFLSNAGWRDLPKWSIEAESTDNLMRSGVVRLTLPESAVSQSTEMPGEGKWIAICSDTHLSAFPRLLSVSINGVRAIRLRPEGASEEDAVPPAPDSLYLEVPRQGVAGIERVGAAFSGAEAEQTENFRARVGERLRHRNRAVTAWDAERLVLEAFPEVWKAKCFPVLDRTTSDPVPGAVSLVVVPHPPSDAAENPAQPRMFDVLTLRKIEAEIAGSGSPFADLKVSNPSYERLQVRARIGFQPGRDDGALMQQLKLAVSKYLSVWTARAPLNGFGWGVHLNDVGAHIANLDYVDFFSELSVLQLVADDVEKYRLLDTARAMPGPPGMTSDLKYRAPWSLPLPMPEHWIVPARERVLDPAIPTGIGGLAVGQTLVIDRG